jgi:hypothetical protein
VSDFLSEKHREISARLDKLKPLVDEYNRLEDAASALAKVIGSAASEATSAASAVVTRRRKKGRGRPRGSASRSSKATPASAPASAAPASAAPASAAPASASTATPKVARKKPSRPKGSGKKPPRPPGSATKASSTKAATSPAKRRGRSKGSGKRATEALSLVRGAPGITIPELAAKMGIKQNYLYRVLPGLEKEGKLEKKGRGWHPKGA